MANIFKIYVTLIVFLLGLTAHSQDIEYNGIYYYLSNSSKTATVSWPTYNDSIGNRYEYYAGIVNIPSSIQYEGNNYTVEKITFEAFRSQGLLTTVIIPETIKEIGYRAFWGCTELKNVIFSGNSQLKRIERETFNTCRKLSTITFPNSLTFIGDHAFESSGLCSINGGESIITIDDAAFKNCPFSEINIPNSVIKIGDHAFWGCGYLTKVVMGNSVEHIGLEAFLDCQRLQEVNLPNSLTFMDDFAFRGCWSLQRIDIPNSLKKLGDGAFKYCTSLEEVTLGSSLQEIGGWAFEQTKIKNIKFPNSLKIILPYAFQDCAQLENIEWGDSLETIGAYAFAYCTNLTKLNLPSSINKISQNAFSACTKLTEVTIPPAELSDRAFSHCDKLNDFYNLAINPQNIYYREVFYSSGYNNNNPNNVINIHVYEGLHDIYASTMGWGDDYRLVIIDDIPIILASSIIIEDAPFECVIGESMKPTVSFSPENVSFKSLRWTSSDMSVVYIDEFSGEFFGLSKGTATITATTTDGTNLSATAIVNVVDDSAIDAVNVDMPIIIASKGHISIRGGNVIKIYTTNGVLVSHSNEEDVTPGVYIISVDGKTSKVIVK